MSASSVHSIPGIKKILALISLTEGSRETLTLALCLAKQCGGEVILLHVIDLSRGVPAEDLGLSREEAQGVLRRESESEMTLLVQWAVPQVPTRIVVREGSLLEVIARTTIESAIDLVLVCPQCARQLWRT